MVVCVIDPSCYPVVTSSIDGIGTSLMASFNTHFNVGLVVSGLVATGTLVAGIATPGEAFIYLGLGALGSLLPDLDAANSIPTRIGAGLLSISLAFTVVFLLAKRLLSPLELLGAWIITFLFFRYLVFALVTRLTVHRGLFHSIPAGIALGLTTTVLAANLMQQPSLKAWLAGAFIAGGYLVHLLLDECYSIDWAGRKVRRSIGSACKLWSNANWLGTLGLYLACVGLYVLSPPSPRLFLHTLVALKAQASLPQFVSGFKWGESDRSRP